MWCDLIVVVVSIFKERVKYTDVFGLNLLDTASEFVNYSIGICWIRHRNPPPPRHICMYYPTGTTFAHCAAVLPVCLRPAVHVSNCSGSFVTATKPLLTLPSRVCLERITLAHIM
jgi:hypothetical protein